MTTARLPLRLIETIAVKPGFRLDIAWAGGDRTTVDLSESIASGGVFAPLRDPVLFEKVCIGARKRTIEWPEPGGATGSAAIDIDADALSAMSPTSGIAVAAGKASRRAGSPGRRPE